MTPVDSSIEPPEGLSDDALDMFHDVTTDNPTMKPAQFAALVQASRLVTLADGMTEALGTAYLVDGYKGQPVPNGLLSEIRQARAAAVSALRASGLTSYPSGASAAGAALVGHRWGR